jgi:hypothetical protein
VAATASARKTVSAGKEHHKRLQTLHNKERIATPGIEFHQFGIELRKTIVTARIEMQLLEGN